jgi:methyl-accepting chemotaxis protein
MKWFYNMKIGTKLLSGFILMALLAGVIGWVGVSNIREIAAKDTKMYQNSVIPIAELGAISTAFQRARVNLAKALLDNNRQNKEKYLEQIKALSAEVTKLTGELEKNNTSAEEKALLKEFGDCRNVFRPIIARIIDLSIAGKDAEAIALYHGDAVTAALAEQAVIDKLVDHNTREARQASEQNTAKAHSAGQFTLIFALLSMVLSVGLGIFISRTITAPLAKTVSAADRIARGDLTVNVEVNSKDETGLLLSAMKNMVENLRNMASNMNDISAGIASASNQLHSTSEQIATGVEEVAAQAGTVATASEEMAATSNDIARNCTFAAEASQQSTDSAQTGARVVHETITGMSIIADRVRGTSKTVEALGSRSEQIGEIIGTIEDIADQTNLLALNAAIEAARAGEQGRGFAVVADEVRALAERTTKATKEIGEMIKAIQSETREAVRAMEEGVREAEKGASSAEKSGEALDEIISRIGEVAMQVSQIATAAEQQTATTGEVTGNIQQITEVVNQTARGAEETASAAAQLAGQARELQTLVGRFRLA